MDASGRFAPKTVVVDSVKRVEAVIELGQSGVIGLPRRYLNS